MARNAAGAAMPGAADGGVDRGIGWAWEVASVMPAERVGVASPSLWDSIECALLETGERRHGEAPPGVVCEVARSGTGRPVSEVSVSRRVADSALPCVDGCKGLGFGRLVTNITASVASEQVRQDALPVLMQTSVWVD